jgi:hypothetical protein
MSAETVGLLGCRSGRLPCRHAPSADLLAAYDEQLRTDAETPSALAVAHLGPLRLVTFAGARGFVTYRDLGGETAGSMCCVRLCALSGSVAAFPLLSSKSGVELQHIIGIPAGRDLLGRIADM